MLGHAMRSLCVSLAFLGPGGGCGGLGAIGGLVGAKAAITGVAQAGNDEAAIVDAFVDGS